MFSTENVTVESASRVSSRSSNNVNLLPMRGAPCVGVCACARVRAYVVTYVTQARFVFQLVVVCRELLLRGGDRHCVVFSLLLWLSPRVGGAARCVGKGCVAGCLLECHYE